MFWRKFFVISFLIFILVSPIRVFAEDGSDAVGLPGESGAATNDENAAEDLFTTCVNGDLCKLVDKICNKDEDCQGYALKGGEKCFKNSCYLDAVGQEKFNKSVSVLGLTDLKADLQIKKPWLSINIPGLKFSDISSSTITKEGDKVYLNIPYIGEYLAAIYKVGLVVISIVAVAMIIVIGVKIIAGGSEGRVEGFKRIAEIAVGLFIGWGSFTMLSIINPDLVNFKALKVQYIEQQELPVDLPDDGEAENVPKIKICNTYDTCKPFCNGNQPNIDLINKVAAEKNIKIPAGLTEIRPMFRQKLAGKCKFGKPGSMYEFLDCGIALRGSESGNFSLPSTADGLVKAGAAAKSQGYALSIGTITRPLQTQVKLVCNWINRNPQGGVKICQNSADHSPKPLDESGNPINGKNNGLGCPGVSNHFSGFAVDLCLVSLGKPGSCLTEASGEAYSCEASKAKEMADPDLLTLNKIMFDNGWWKYWEERWHFEYTSSPSPLRKNTNNCP